MPKSMKARVQNKHDIEANWINATNFKPLPGEVIIYDPDENHLVPRIKIGDGETFVNQLPFVGSDLVSVGVDDPDDNITSQFYFKYDTV